MMPSIAAGVGDGALTPALSRAREREHVLAPARAVLARDCALSLGSGLRRHSLAPGNGFKVVTNERYARPDTSVTGQVLKVISTTPDEVSPS